MFNFIEPLEQQQAERLVTFLLASLTHSRRILYSYVVVLGCYKTLLLLICSLNYGYRGVTHRWSEVKPQLGLRNPPLPLCKARNFESDGAICHISRRVR
jgi:hypothetical protein